MTLKDLKKLMKNTTSFYIGYDENISYDIAEIVGWNEAQFDGRINDADTYMESIGLEEFYLHDEDELLLYDTKRFKRVIDASYDNFSLDFFDNYEIDFIANTEEYGLEVHLKG